MEPKSKKTKTVQPGIMNFFIRQPSDGDKSPQQAVLPTPTEFAVYQSSSTTVASNLQNIETDCTDNNDTYDVVESSKDLISITPSPDDVGFVIQKELNRQHVTDEEILTCLEKRWISQSKHEFPFSVSHQGKRYLGSHYLTTYPWLAVSRVQGLEGAWCIWCSVFNTTKEGGGTNNSGGQVLGALVRRPLTKFHKLTGKEGELSSHNETHYHKWAKEKVHEF